MARGDGLYDELRDALEDTTPPCNNDDRFVSDDLKEWDRVRLRGICRTCPLFDKCSAYSNAVKPAGGFWAGKDFTKENK